MTSAEQHIHETALALQKVDYNHPAVSTLGPSMYRPDAKLRGHIDKFFTAWARKRVSKVKSKTRDLACGKLLEEVAFLIFKGLAGVVLDSYQSAAGPQYDVMASGHSDYWDSVAKCLYLGNSRPGILIEAKAWTSRIEDSTFSRMCALIDHNLNPTVRLGVFITLEGASGFPKRGAKRKRAVASSVTDCALRQLLFQARTGCFVVVLDRHDLELLRNGGNLIKLLREYIEEVNKQRGLLPLHPVPAYAKSVALPRHLARLLP